MPEKRTLCWITPVMVAASFSNLIMQARLIKGSRCTSLISDDDSPPLVALPNRKAFLLASFSVRVSVTITDCAANTGDRVQKVAIALYLNSK